MNERERERKRANTEITPPSLHMLILLASDDAASAWWLLASLGTNSHTDRYTLAVITE